MNFSKEQKDYIIHALEHCEVLTGGRSSGKTLELIKQQDKEIERLHSIIKEVREYIENNKQYAELEDYGKNGEYYIDEIGLLEILDKEKDDE